MPGRTNWRVVGSAFSVLRNCQAGSQRGCSILRSHQQSATRGFSVFRASLNSLQDGPGNPTSPTLGGGFSWASLEEEKTRAGDSVSGDCLRLLSPWSVQCTGYLHAPPPRLCRDPDLEIPASRTVGKKFLSLSRPGGGVWLWNGSQRRQVGERPALRAHPSQAPGARDATSHQTENAHESGARI